MRKLHTLLAIVLLVASTPAWSVERGILVLGDSLSAAYGIDVEQGWVNLLQKRLRLSHPQWQVVNGSVTGDTTAGGLSRLPLLLQRHQPEVVIIELGSNDGLRGLSFKQLRKNLQGMIDLVDSSGGKVLLIGGRLPPNYGEVYTEAFFRLFQEVAKANSLPLVPFLLERVAQDRGLMQADGYHPSAQAQHLILDNVWPVLDPML